MGADLTVERRLRALVGPDAAIESDRGGIPLVAPHTTAACALVLRTAHAEGWSVRIVGNATWIAPDAPAQLTLSSQGLSQIEDVRTADLVATVQAGVRHDALRLALADHGAWWPVDAPGTNRTLGSLIATATAGPLRSGFGSIREHILGLTIVTADGRVVKSGGSVVKNVAGFDLTKLATGSFGAFGFIAAAHLRLRAIPRADVTLVTGGDRDALIQEAREILDAGLTPSALELMSPSVSGAHGWTLAVRLLGADPSVAAERSAVRAAGTAAWTEMSSADAADFWPGALRRTLQQPLAVRVGTVITGLHQALDLLSHHLDDDFITASVTAGAVRWSGSAVADRIQLMRHAAAQIEMPVTIERGPWALRNELGHFGAYREQVSRLMSSLRTTFDPNGTLVVPLGAQP